MVRNTLFIIWFALFWNTGMAQSVHDPEPENETAILSRFYPGGKDSLSNFIEKYILFSRNTLRHAIYGSVWVGLTINELGQPIHIAIEKGLKEDVDSAAVLVVSKLRFQLANLDTVGLSKHIFSFPIDIHISGRIKLKNKKFSTGVSGMLCFFDGQVINNPLVDAKPIWLSKISPDMVGYEKLIKPKDATELFGKRGRYGALLIYSKLTYQPESIDIRLRYVLDHCQDTSLKKSPEQIDSIKNSFWLVKPKINVLKYRYTTKNFEYINVYPRDAQVFNVMGRVILNFNYFRNGKVSDIEVVAGNEIGSGLVKGAIDLIKQLPRNFYRLDGKPLDEIALKNFKIDFGINTIILELL